MFICNVAQKQENLCDWRDSIRTSTLVVFGESQLDQFVTEQVELHACESHLALECFIMFQDSSIPIHSSKI